MIQRLHISGFKCFRDLELPRLGRINLFVGKNNTGKSSILEAVDLFASNSQASLIEACARRVLDRSTDRFIRPHDPQSAALLVSLFVSLCHREKSKNLKSEIEISSDDPKSHLRIDANGYPIETLERQLRDLVGENSSSEVSRKMLAVLIEEGLSITRGDSNSTHRILRDFDKEFFRIREGDASPWSHPQAARTSFLPSRGMSLRDSKQLWDQASIYGKDLDILEWMRFIEPEINDLRFLGDEEAGENKPHIRLNGNPGFTPLASLGDGLTRIFHLALAMGSAEKGILLIDEFENGLHWSVQKQLWQAIGKAAQSFDMQVFATTHSIDCVHALTQAQEDKLFDDPICVYRLERKGDEIIARDLPLDAVESALEFHVEVR